MAFLAVINPDYQPKSEEGILHWLTLNKFFLRDDYNIRKDVKAFAGREQAWSLFWIDPDDHHSRVIVLNIEGGGTYETMLERALVAAKAHLAVWKPE